MIRGAIEADLQVCTDVWWSTRADAGAGPIGVLPLHGHELRSGQLLVAEVDGDVVGFGATLTRSGVAYLADLFVAPPHQHQGIGSRLAHALCDEHPGPLFTFASTDDRATRLYASLGMQAVEPYHYLACDLGGDLGSLEQPDSDLALRAVEPVEIVAIDRRITRRQRRADIDFVSSLGATWYVGRRSGVAVGAVAVTTMTWNPWHPRSMCIGPVLADDPGDVAQLMSAAIAKARVADVDRVCTYVPSSLACLPLLLDAGFEVLESDLLMATDDSVLDRRRYLPLVDTP